MSQKTGQPAPVSQSNKPQAKGSEVRRSASQVMFGYLPEQTVDIEGGVWKVQKWRRPHLERAVDTNVLRDAVLNLAQEWSRLGRDQDYASKLRSGRRQLNVLSLDRANGVEAAPFPRIWICSECRRVHRNIMASCPCGKKARKASLQFVSYCRNCGDVDEPPILRCSAHNEVAIRFPGSMSATDIIQYCPTCDSRLRSGFAGKKCKRCGSQLTAQVHRAASVYTPQFVAIVNAATRDQIERLERAGGSAKALQWMLQGMKTRSMEESPAGEESLRAALSAQNLSSELIDQFVEAARNRGEIPEVKAVSVPEEARVRAEAEARSVAMALMSSRQTISDLIKTGPVRLRPIYQNEYGKALQSARLDAIDFTDRFPMLTGSFGYTRGPSSNAQESVLVPFMDEKGDFVVYGEIAETEALFVRLSPAKVARWLVGIGVSCPASDNDQESRRLILKAVGEDSTGRAQEALTTLIHSYSHRFIKTAAVYTGVESSSLSEYLTPYHLGFFVYASSRGSFVLGGLQAVFEGELHLLLREFVGGEHRCALDPGCSQTGSACMACLHLGEPSCRMFNRYLDRSVLHGSTGYLST